MGHLSYKGFVWNQSPHTYQEDTFREAMYHTQDGVKIFDGITEVQRIITGSGVFSGENAYTDFKALQQLMEEETAGNLQHPVWGIRYCYLTRLELTQEPKDNVVSYRFEFTQALGNGVIPA